MTADDIAESTATGPTEPTVDVAAPTPTPDRTGEASPARTGKGRAAAVEESLSMSDVATEVARDVIAGRKPGEAAAGGETPPVEKPAAPAPTTPDAGFDPAAMLQAIADHPTPEAVRQAALQTKHWQDQANAYIDSISEQAAVAVRERAELAQRITRLYDDPTFRQALDHFVRQKQGGGGATALPGAAGLPRLDDCETDTERALVTHIQQQAATMQRLQQEISGLRGGQQRFEEFSEAQQTGQFGAVVKQLHAELDKKYPALATPENYAKWHALAARLWDPEHPVEGQSDLTSALEQAARLLTYDDAKNRGAAEAAAAARKVARTQTVPEGRLAATAAMGDIDEDTPMSEIAERLKSGGMIPAAV